MAISPFDSAIHHELFHDKTVGRLFSDTAETRAMMLVLGTMAKVQGELGMIPPESGAAIHRASLEIQIDPGAMAAEVSQNAVCVPALVRLFREEMNAPEHAQYVHWGATSQDIMDTGLTLRLRQVVAMLSERLGGVARALGTQAAAHADLPMAGRTYGQNATPISFGAMAASWGAPMLRLSGRLDALSPRLLTVSLSGAAGTLSAMGPEGAAVRAGLAQALNLTDPGESWHAQRDRITEFAGLLTDICLACAKMGEDLTLLTQTGIGEVTLPGAGGSSTMPQKQNPVAPSVLVALGRLSVGLNSVIAGAAIHRQQRDGAAWITEWLTLPQLCMAAARALIVSQELAAGLQPNAAPMADHIDDGGLGLAYAEALSFALARVLPRPEAQAAVKAMCKEARASGTPLPVLAGAAHPDLDITTIFTPEAQLGAAPAEARAFAKAAGAL